MSYKDKSIKELEDIQLEVSKTLEQKKEEERKRLNTLKEKQTMSLILAANDNPAILEFFPHARNSCGDSLLKNAHFNYKYKTAKCNRCLFEEMVCDYQASFNKEDFSPNYLISLDINFESND